MTSLLPGWLSWQTSPTYVTSTCFPFSFRMTNLTFTLHSGRLHSAPPLKNTAEWIFREFSDLTWLFLKRKLHHGLLSLTLLRKIRVQSPLNNRPPLGKVLIGILAQSSFVNLNLAVVPSMFLRKYFFCFLFPSSSDESESSEYSWKHLRKALIHTLNNFNYTRESTRSMSKKAHKILLYTSYCKLLCNFKYLLTRNHSSLSFPRKSVGKSAKQVSAWAWLRAWVLVTVTVTSQSRSPEQFSREGESTRSLISNNTRCRKQNWFEVHLKQLKALVKWNWWWNFTRVCIISQRFEIYFLEFSYQKLCLVLFV